MVYNIIYLSLVFWVSGIIFFSFVVAPVVFKTLDREKAREVDERIFPLYYKLGYICEALTLISFFAPPVKGEQF